MTQIKSERADSYVRNALFYMYIHVYINRADGLEKQILSGKICGTKSRERQRTKYTDSLNIFLTRKESPNKHQEN